MNICLFADAQSVHIRQLTRHLAQRGHRLHVVTHKPAQLSDVSVERFAVPAPSLLNPRGWNARRHRYLQDFFRNFDIVNVHFLADWGLSEVVHDRSPSDARLVATAWGSDIVDPPGETPATPQLRRARIDLLKNADALTTCGAAFAKEVAEFAAIPVESIDVVPFGVDVSLFAPGNSLGLEAPRIGFFKGFRPVYGPTVLIRAVPAILAACPAARFELIGDGAELQRCRELAEELGVSHAIDWVGRLEHAQLPARLRHWTLSIIPSLHESFGVAALESQAASVPVVASAVDGLHDTVLEGETGLLFPVGDSGALAARVIELLCNHGMRNKLAARGRQWVADRFSWPDLAGVWESLYSRIREQSCVTV